MSNRRVDDNCAREACPECKGSGEGDSGICSNCDGTGGVPKNGPTERAVALWSCWHAKPSVLIENRMKIARSQLNATEQKVYDLINPNLDELGSIVVLKEEGDRIRLDVISPNHFQRAAAALEEACGAAARATSISIDVNLTTHWPTKARAAIASPRL